MDTKRIEAGQKLLDAALDYWKACCDEFQDGSVQWLEGSNGELLIFTRSEYRQTLMANIHGLSNAKVHFFHGEVIPANEDSE